MPPSRLRLAPLPAVDAAPDVDMLQMDTVWLEWSKVHGVVFAMQGWLLSFGETFVITIVTLQCANGSLGVSLGGSLLCELMANPIRSQVDVALADMAQLG
eukprot:5702775-Amphidinium_carterae.1